MLIVWRCAVAGLLEDANPADTLKVGADKDLHVVSLSWGRLAGAIASSRCAAARMPNKGAKLLLFNDPRAPNAACYSQIGFGGEHRVVQAHAPAQDRYEHSGATHAGCRTVPR